MDYTQVFKIKQRDQNLNCKSSDKIRTESAKPVLFEKIIEVNRQPLKHNAEMIAKIEVLNHSNNVFAIFRVIVFYVLKQSNFNHPLLLEFLLIPHYFKGNINVFLMIKTK